MIARQSTVSNIGPKLAAKDRSRLTVKDKGGYCHWRTLLFCLCLAAAMFSPRPGLAADETDWQVTLKSKFMFNSHTSYEFGNPNPPYQLLSRLEFPMDSVWVGAEVRRRFGRASLGLEYLNSLADHESGIMKDSDWEDENAPTLRTTYSESKCRMRPSIRLSADIDLELADLAHLPEAVSFRPVVGFRWQHLSFVAHDGVQYTLGQPGEPDSAEILTGDGISFEQDWYQYFVGLRLGYTWNRPPLLRWIRFDAQGDLSLVEGQNLDKHLLRGDRTTRENTMGHAWHSTAGIAMGLTEHLGLGLEWEYLSLTSAGEHRYEYVAGGDSTVMSWTRGVRVWSEQSSLSLKLDYSF